MVKHLLKKAGLYICLLSFISCADSLNAKIGYKIPDESEHPEKPYNDDNGGDNNNGDDDLPPEDSQDSIDVRFENSGSWHWHFFSDNEFCVEQSLTEPLDCLRDCIEFTIKGTPNKEVSGLYLQLCNDDGEIVCYHIPERFMAGVQFEKTVEAPLSANYDPNKNTWFNLCYDTSSGWNNLNGLEIDDFSISARAIKNCGFKFFKNVWNSNVDTDFNYQHNLKAYTFMDNLQTENYLNLDFVCASPEAIFNLRVGIYTSNGIYKDYRFCELNSGRSRIKVSIPIDDRQRGTKLENIQLNYDTQDVNYPITWGLFTIDDLEFSDSAKYTIIDPNEYKDLRTKLFPQDSYSFENGTLTIKDSRALENITYNTNFWEGTGINKYDVDTIIISEGITEIPANSFDVCINVTSIFLPSTLTSIGLNAFVGNDCSYIKIPCNVTVLDENALRTNFKSLIEFDWPSYDTTPRDISDRFVENQDSTIIYNDGELYNHEYLNSFTGVSWYCNADKTLYVYGKGTICVIKKTNWEFDDITKIVFTSGITAIDDTLGPVTSLCINYHELLETLPNLSSIVLPETLNYIYAHIFSDLKIPEITIPSSVTEIFAWAFEYWTSSQIIHLDWPSTDTKSHIIEDNAFGEAQVYYNDGVKYQ